uniref:SHSP domain-containing protein n=2 Tax=Scylla olivacea TaxID=85551 RepID=A0A0P4VY54_SCYOL
MSSDGILTITVPKKEDVQMIASNFKMVNAGNTSKAESSSINSSSKLVKESNSKTSIHTETAVDTEKQVSSNTTCSDKWETDSNYSVESTKISNGHLDAKRRSSWELDSLLPVFPKGPFFHDSYFKESRQHFDAAVKEALSRLGHEETQTDNFSLYRNLRMSDMTDHSQAVKVTENEQVHQVVLDVHDFLGGDIKVKVVGRNEVQVEGRIEKEEGGCMSMRSFCRSFHLPGVVDVDAVTSCLSSDGVLTIKAPKGAAGSGRGGC